MTIALIAKMLSSVALWGLLLAFGYWIHRQCQFRSFPWLIAYFVCSLVFPIAIRFGLELFISRGAFPPGGGSLGNWVSELTYWQRFFSDMSLLLLVLLVVSDIWALLIQTRIEVGDSFWNHLLIVRNHSVMWGVAMLIVQILPVAGLNIYVLLA